MSESKPPPVLVAEDEAMLRMIAVEMLQDSGFTVFEAADGVEALDLLKAHPDIAVLVSDIRMPRMDGYALVEQGLALRPALKVLMMTGYAQEPPARLRAAHDIQILYKPFNMEKLCAMVAEMVG